MAARKNKTLSEDWRKKIQTSMLLNRLHNHIKVVPGDKDFIKNYMDKSQVSAALGLLKKTLPDLQNIELGNKPGEKFIIAWDE